ISGTNSAGTAIAWRVRNTNALLVLDSPTAFLASGSPFTFATNGAFTAANNTLNWNSSGQLTVVSLTSANSISIGNSSALYTPNYCSLTAVASISPGFWR